MSDPTPRRPRFLAAVPESPRASPLRFAPAAAPTVVVQPPPPPPPPAPPPAAAPPSPPAHEPRAAHHAPPPRAADVAEAHREALRRVAAAVETLRAQAAHLGEQARADALEIGFLVARTLLESEVRQSPQAVFQLVRQAVRRAGDSRRISVRLSPEDAAIVNAENGRAPLFGPAAARVEIAADPSLSRGDCVVDTDFGRVDGRLETRLAELRRALEAGAHGDAQEVVA
jgi:flagellar biosynthesis/type III secretory pathway protein FliH